MGRQFNSFLDEGNRTVCGNNYHDGVSVLGCESEGGIKPRASGPVLIGYGKAIEDTGESVKFQICSYMQSAIHFAQGFGQI